MNRSVMPFTPTVQSDAIGALCPFIIRKGREIVAAFAQKSEAANWVREYSDFRDTQSTFYLCTAQGIIAGYRDGKEVEVP